MENELLVGPLPERAIVYVHLYVYPNVMNVVFGSNFYVFGPTLAPSQTVKNLKHRKYEKAQEIKREIMKLWIRKFMPDARNHFASDLFFSFFLSTVTSYCLYSYLVIFNGSRGVF